MNIHEFQGKSLLSQFDIPVQPGVVLDLKKMMPVMVGVLEFQKMSTMPLNKRIKCWVKH